ncbi:MAG: T9SS type A sorting domain-containing protein [Candidatus Marinimicrobia bacterium]|nr:T9SS type A sorting domain-containing protein [Candidatus Neomarinimicrobiota bacterium]
MDYDNFDQEFIYLAFLGKNKIKPLSRWEDKFDYQHIDLLKNLGLKSGIIYRKLRNGKKSKELIFGKQTQYINIYQNNFDNQPITKSYHEQLLEGKLFGYPLCCIKNFIENGYTENEFQGEGQEILFHWACPGCKVTPQLIPIYRDIYDQLNGQNFDKPKCSAFLKSAIASLLVVSLGTNIQAQDAHMLPVDKNGEENYLSYQEEILFGYHRLAALGDIIAIKYYSIIDSLPNVEKGDSCYKIENKMRGVVECPICGKSINMGYIELNNPMRNLSIEIDYLALHFMQNGSFSYGDSVDNERLGTEKLKRILNHYDDSHDGDAIDPNNDSDNDGLRDCLERKFDNYSYQKDSNYNGLLDGAEVAEKIILNIASLPVVEYDGDSPHDTIYVKYGYTCGSEKCKICDILINMGEIDIVNPNKKSSIKLPIISLHYLAHGRLIYSGSRHSHEIDVLKLAEVLELETQGAHLIPVGDVQNNNYLTDVEKILLGTRYQYNYNNRRLDSLYVPLLAKHYYRLIDQLPGFLIGNSETPVDSCYKILADMDGIEVCPICGKEIAMGYLELHNPMRNLSTNITYMGLHFLKHGSFAFKYSFGFPYNSSLVDDTSRINIKRLKMILNHYDHSHDSVTLEFDADEDGLVDSVETLFDMDNTDKDSDDNKLLDGAQVAESLLDKIAGIPVVEYNQNPPDDRVYMKFSLTYGLEDCNVCSCTFNMGSVEIIDPRDHITFSMPIIGLHYLAHGKLSYSGTIHDGEIDIARLYKVLENVSAVKNQYRTKAFCDELALKFYPNPFNSRLKIMFTIPENGKVKINIYDIRGRNIKTVIDQTLVKGKHEYYWDGKNNQGNRVSSGIYFLRLGTNNSANKIIKRVVLVQ